MKNSTTFEDFKSQLKLKRKILFCSFRDFFEFSPSDAVESCDRLFSTPEPDNRKEHLQLF